MCRRRRAPPPTPYCHIVAYGGRLLRENSRLHTNVTPGVTLVLSRVRVLAAELVVPQGGTQVLAPLEHSRAATVSGGGGIRPHSCGLIVRHQ